MKQYGVRIKRKKDGKESYMDVFHLPLSYMDWAVYSGSKELFDPATIRYLLNQYVVRVIEEGAELSINQLLESDMSIIETVIGNMIKKSIFQNQDDFTQLVMSLDKASRTLSGCYDLFIFQHLGPDFYLRMLEADAYTRAQVIMMVEKTTGISVKERFDEAVAKNIPLDIMSSPDQYKRAMKKYGMPRPNMGARRRSPLDEFKETAKDIPIPPTKDKMPSNVDAMIADARSSLADALNAGRNKTQRVKPAFDWQKDQGTFEQFENE
jgi:hypothetical protein